MNHILGNYTNIYSTYYNTRIVGNDTLTKNSLYIIDAFFNTLKSINPNILNILLSYPSIHTSLNKVTITYLYYIPTSINTDTLNSMIVPLSTSLSTLYGKSVDIRLIQIHYPYMNSRIFAQYLIHNNDTNTFSHIVDAFNKYPNFGFNSLNSHISGIKVELNGRIYTEPKIPRLTTKSAITRSF